ncbi:MAG: hypothetical protein AAB847_00345 [Patescibacteria group bacterium]
MFKWFLRAILILAFGFAAFAGFYWFSADNDSGVEIIFQPSNDQIIKVGQPFDLTVNVINNSDNILSSSKLTLVLPEGVVFAGEPEDKNVANKILGDIGVGGVNSQDFKLIVLNNPNSVKNLESALTYNIGSATSRFEERKNFSLLVGESAIDLKLEVPEKTLSDDNFEIKISYQNNSDSNVKDLELKIDYPPVFKFYKSTLKPDDGNDSWDLGGLNKRSENKFAIIGSLIAPPNTKVDFKARLRMSILGQVYNINEQIATTIIDTSPFEIKINLNESDNYVAMPGDILNYIISFSNQLSSLSVQLGGEMLDWSGYGSYALNWNNPTSPITFQAKVKSNYSIKRLGDKNFVIKASAEGRLDDKISVAKLETKISGKMEVRAKGFFRDALAGILNKGSLPPQVGQATDFTIHWLLKNYGTDVKNVRVSAVLPEGVEFTDRTKSSLPVGPTYNASTREVIWSIERILATSGALGDPIEAVFQVTLTPTLAMVGKYAPLIGVTQVTATDEFTDQILNSSSPEITTALPDDNTVGAQGVIVK